ncbi:hypothetical protein [Salsuginibacillus kocurii]|uniref:hypothetical protein n=1 Tax=Salsuginibacillus kocurii TaxID=427078 RepID=UPI0003798C70|nr:hypothetical protein [Salsuginibacillus kocurii]
MTLREWLAKGLEDKVATVTSLILILIACGFGWYTTTLLHVSNDEFITFYMGFLASSLVMFFIYIMLFRLFRNE